MRWRRDNLRAAAPKNWDKAHTSVARLHRRLIVAVEAAETEVQNLRKANVAAYQLEKASTDLRAQAVVMTQHLVVISRLPLLKRQRALQPIRHQVDDVEWLSARIGTSAIEARTTGAVEPGLTDIADRLASLEAGRSLLSGM